jgi:hypothetical protein
MVVHTKAYISPPPQLKQAVLVDLMADKPFVKKNHLDKNEPTPYHQPPPTMPVKKPNLQPSLQH